MPQPRFSTQNVYLWHVMVLFLVLSSVKGRDDGDYVCKQEPSGSRMNQTGACACGEVNVVCQTKFAEATKCVRADETKFWDCEHNPRCCVGQVDQDGLHRATKDQRESTSSFWISSLKLVSILFIAVNAVVSAALCCKRKAVGRRRHQGVRASVILPPNVISMPVFSTSTAGSRPTVPIEAEKPENQQQDEEEEDVTEPAATTQPPSSIANQLRGTRTDVEEEEIHANDATEPSAGATPMQESALDDDSPVTVEYSRRRDITSVMFCGSLPSPGNSAIRADAGSSYGAA